ncbi:lipid-A-disaccharide synthase [bacterium]|jgi:lipid-A-disaccharide synthase|nr:lipid-A-disaccharide synthase [bacterium]
MPVRLFFSVGEPSGDIHAANLIKAVRTSEPSLVPLGLGGPRMAEAGCEIMYPLVNNPIMGMQGVLRAIPFLRGLLKKIAKTFETDRPDAVVLVDYPGFNWHVARLAKKHGIPVIYYVPPQIWAWASFRVARMKKYVDHILCSLPFEEAWYRSKGVDHSVYVGHPFFDDLALAELDHSLIQSLKASAPVGRVALLPGSRPSEVDRNGRLLVRTAKKIQDRVPGVSISVAAFDERAAQKMAKIAHDNGMSLDIHTGKTREILASADAAVSVSGSVSLELLYYEVPTTIIYTIHNFYRRVIMPMVLHTPYITLVNLLAGQKVFPEFLGPNDFSGPIADQIVEWLTKPAARGAVRQKLKTLRTEYADAGASTFAANYILHDVLGQNAATRKAA